MNIELLLEAERRGILPDDKAALLAEARNRGLVPANEEAPKEGGFFQTANQFRKRANETMTAGLLGDEFQAVLDTPIGKQVLRSLPMGALVADTRPTGSYDERLGARRQEQEQFAEDNPGLALTADISGAGMAALTPAGAVGTAAKGAGVAQRIAQSALGGGLFGALYGGMEGEGMDDRLTNARDTGALGAAVGGVLPALGGAVQKFANSRANRKVVDGLLRRAPATDDLIEEATGFYDDAARSGATATPEQTMKVADAAASTFVEEGLTGPSGKMPQGYTKAVDGMDLLLDYAENSMNPKQMQNVRRTLTEAARQPGSEGRIGSILVDQFDEVMEPLAPQIKQGNASYARAMKSRTLEQMDELAKQDAGVNYSQAGYEQALRRRYSNLLKRITEGKETGWSEAEVAAIRKVASGGALENTARAVGRGAPRGIVNVGIGGGMPFMIGNAIAGPGMGAALAAGSMATGEIGRRIATSAQSKNAAIARALAASGGNQPLTAVATDQMRRIAEGLTRRLPAAGSQ